MIPEGGEGRESQTAGRAETNLWWQCLECSSGKTKVQQQSERVKRESRRGRGGRMGFQNLMYISIPGGAGKGYPETPPTL